MIATTSITPFQRVLLGADGTVTHILEAYADEPVEAAKLLQERDVSGDGDATLALAKGTPVIRRKVLLRGRFSRINLLYAEAVLVPGRLDSTIVEGLTATNRPIGTLLAESRMETFREILSVGRELAGSCAQYFATDADSEFLFRTYRIVSRRQAVLLITEKFPAESFRGLQA